MLLCRNPLISHLFLYVPRESLKSELCRVSSVCAGDPRIVISGGDTRCSITINNVTSGDWGDWMCLVQDDVDFEKAEEHISVEVGKEALTSLTWGGHEHDHDLGNTIEDGTRYLRVIEDTVTRVQCGVTRAYPRPRVTWSGDRDVTVIPVRSHCRSCVGLMDIRESEEL